MSTTANILAALTLVAQLLQEAQKISALINEAQANDRDLSDDDLEQVRLEAAAARQRLVDAIEGKEGEES